MQAISSPFQSAWMSFDLGEARPCDGTYCFFSYDSLPPIPDEDFFTGDFGWLIPKPSPIAEIYAQTETDALSAQLKKIKAEAQSLGISLPSGFVNFMSNATLRNSIPSCTACYFDLSNSFIPAPIPEGGHFLRFMNDQQDVLLWYIYFSPTGEHCVIVSNIYYDDLEYLESLPEGAIKNSSAYCAPSFEAFLYRFWIENMIWFGVNENEEINDIQKQYLDHYKKS
jgi:hypothetical protein